MLFSKIVETMKSIIIIKRFMIAIIEPIIVSQFFDEGGSFIEVSFLFSGLVKIEIISVFLLTDWIFFAKHPHC